MSPPIVRPERVLCGTCAWSFEDWRGVFYPQDLARNRWLEFYAGRFPAVEMDSTFHHLPSAETAQHWGTLVGPDFRFCPKLPKSLSHEKRLEDPAPEIGMMQRLAGELGGRLGCVLLQLPPSFRDHSNNAMALRRFLRTWPSDLRLAVEFRHESWERPHTARLLEDHGAALVWADSLPVDQQARAGFGFSPVTAGHLYLRLLGDFRTEYGPDGRETHRYGRTLWSRDTALAHWSTKLRQHPEVETIYIFANNHYEGMATETVCRLAALLGLRLPREAAHESQLELFHGDASA